MMINPSSLVEYWPSILVVCLVVIVGMILFGTLGCWWGGETMKDAMQTGFSFVQIGEFSFIIAALGNSLNVTHPALYPIIVASSVVTTFLTPYIMKAAVPSYNFLYNHAPARLRAKMDQREEQAAQAEQQANKPIANSKKAKGNSKLSKVISHTFLTKHLVNLFIENMSKNDEPKEEE